MPTPAPGEENFIFPSMSIFIFFMIRVD